MKGITAKKQHYIPQFYLRKFSQDNNRVYIYDKEIGHKGTIRYQTTIQIAHENNFYTFRTKKGTKGNLEDLFGQFEGDASRIIDVVYRTKKITDKDKAALSWFIAFLYSRTPSFKYKVEESVQKVGEKFMRMSLQMTPREWMKKFFEDKGIYMTDKEIDDLKDFGTNEKRSKLGVTIPPEYWIKMMLSVAPDVASLLYSMNWQFVYTDKPYALITNDCPFLTIPPKVYHPIYGYGFTTPGARKIIPLKSNMCLIIGDISDKPQVLFGYAKKDFYRPVNRNLMIRSERFCFAAEQGKLQKLVKDVKPYELTITERVHVV